MDVHVYLVGAAPPDLSDLRRDKIRETFDIAPEVHITLRDILIGDTAGNVDVKRFVPPGDIVIVCNIKGY